MRKYYFWLGAIWGLGGMHTLAHTYLVLKPDVVKVTKWDAIPSKAGNLIE